MKNIFKTLLFSLVTLTIGYGQVTTSGSFGTASPLTVASVSATGVPTYRMATRVVDGSTQLLDKTFVKTISVGNAWQAQLGLRYFFFYLY